MPIRSRRTAHFTDCLTEDISACVTESDTFGLTFRSDLDRSAAAEGTFRTLVEKAGKTAFFEVSSCSTGGGTADWYKPEVAKFIEMDSVDPRMTTHAIRRGTCPCFAEIVSRLVS